MTFPVNIALASHEVWCVVILLSAKYLNSIVISSLVGFPRFLFFLTDFDFILLLSHSVINVLIFSLWLNMWNVLWCAFVLFKGTLFWIFRILFHHLGLSFFVVVVVPVLVVLFLIYFNLLINASWYVDSFIIIKYPSLSLV